MHTAPMDLGDLRVLFDQLDTLKSGKISVDELVKVIHGVGTEVSMRKATML